MKDVAQQYQEILLSISKFENGNVSDSMNKHGLNYEINYGLSIPVIDELSAKYHSDNELATFLWNRNERECKLLALRIFDTNCCNNTHIELVINGIENIELAEQAAPHFFIKLQNRADIANILIKKENEFCKLAGLILISGIAQINKNMDDVFFINFINQLNSLKLNNSIYLKRGLARALLQIGKRNLEMKEAIIKWIKSLITENNLYKNWLEQEVMYYLIN